MPTNRRRFLKHLLGITAIPAVGAIAVGCTSRGTKPITGRIVGANHKVGHLLRQRNALPKPENFTDVNILVAGGGISGLSAMRYLLQNGATDVHLIEMDEAVGGNSTFGSNKVSAYPWGAHYLPLPDLANKEMIDFLVSAGVITGFDEAQLPIYNEYHLCHDPEERLFINGYWQEGIIPANNIPTSDKQQISRFLSFVETLKTLKGSDGQYCFAIPLDKSSKEDTWRKLDNIPFSKYLSESGYTSPYLLWYLNYCCKDDYGSDLQHTSAWAGLHYFASRRGKAANAPSTAVLTWPEGNGYLMNALKQEVGNKAQTGMLCFHVAVENDVVEVWCYDVHQQKTIGFRANKLLLATPQYINKHLLHTIGNRSQIYPVLKYAPWMVANITFSHLPQGKGSPLCWDNVIYGRDSVGYVFAGQQLVAPGKEGIITYYLPFPAHDPAAHRKNIQTRTHSQWCDYILNELDYAHQGIREHVSNIDVMVWGHGMIRPTPGYIWGAERQIAMEHIDHKIFFAHTDLSGISIFEEAFYQGIRAAKQIMGKA